MRHHRLTVPLMLSAVLVAGLAGTASAADPDEISTPPRSRPALAGDGSPKVHDGRSLTSAPGANGRLTFGRSPYLDVPTAIWSMSSAGSDQQQLTPGGIGVGDVWPSYSPGGTLIAFTRDMTADEATISGDIFLMQANGTGVKQLTATSTNDTGPEFTPDGSRIVFGSYRTGNGDVYSMKLDGTDLRRLTTNTAIDSYPTVSPDGKRIAFASDRNGDLDIYTMNMDGSGVVRLTTAAGPDYQPDWSPDGTKIAFTSGRDGDFEVYAMNANGSSQADLTGDSSYQDFEPAWSPDGTQVAFWSYADADADVYVMASTGGTQTAVGATADDEANPDWQAVPAFPLVDARFSTFKADIEWVFNEGITVGCSAERYCPGDAVTRGQMATFLVRALDLPATSTDYFTDDNGTTHEANINRVREANITVGCAPGKYCPNDVVTRGQMASFLARAFALAATGTDYFTDDNGTTHESNINRLAASGITTGCSPTTYCPSADVTRGQMAAFLRRALEN